MLTIQVPKIQRRALIVLSLERKEVRVFPTPEKYYLKKNFPSRFWILFNILNDENFARRLLFENFPARTPVIAIGYFSFSRSCLIVARIFSASEAFGASLKYFSNSSAACA